MSYQSMAALSDDPAFRERVLACCTEQAQVFVNDGRADIAALATDVIASQNNALGVFELVCVSPDMRDVNDPGAVSDAMILSATQATWPTYAAAVHPAPAP